MSWIVQFIAEYHNNINLFFTFSFLGWIMECLVIRREKGYFENRGFVKGPFCIIYGFGASAAYFLMHRLTDYPILLYLFGAASATMLEYFTARLMLRLFGKFWWDYERKPFNYQGIICLESTVGWGFLALFIVRFLYDTLLNKIQMLPQSLGMSIAALLFTYYGVDFSLSLLKAIREIKGPGSGPKSPDAGRGTYDLV